MGPSWVRANGPIFGKPYIVWVCAPRYRPLSCRKSRIREKRTSKFGSNSVALMYCIHGVYSVHIWQRFQGSLVKGPTCKNWKSLIPVTFLLVVAYFRLFVGYSLLIFGYLSVIRCLFSVICRLFVAYFRFSVAYLRLIFYFSSIICASQDQNEVP